MFNFGTTSPTTPTGVFIFGNTPTPPPPIVSPSQLAQFPPFDQNAPSAPREPIKQVAFYSFPAHLDFRAKYKQLFNNKELSDVCFTFPDSEDKVYAHRAILAVWSNYFGTMLLGAFSEKEEKEISLNDVDPQAFREVICFLYTGELTIDDTTVWSYLELANMYHIELLKELCSDYLKKNINVNNVIQVYCFADLHTLTGLKTQCIEYINTAFMQIWPKDQFLSLTIDQLAEILDGMPPIRDDTHAALIEQAKLESIRKWVQHAVAQKRGTTSNEGFTDATEDSQKEEAPAKELETKRANDEEEEEEEEKGKEKEKEQKSEPMEEKEKEKEKGKEKEKDQDETDDLSLLSDEVAQYKEELLSRLLDLVRFHYLDGTVLNTLENDHEIMQVEGMPGKLLSAWKYKAGYQTSSIQERETKRRRLTENAFSFDIPPMAPDRRGDVAGTPLPPRDFVFTGGQSITQPSPPQFIFGMPPATITGVFDDSSSGNVGFTPSPSPFTTATPFGSSDSGGFSLGTSRQGQGRRVVRGRRR